MNDHDKERIERVIKFLERDIFWQSFTELGAEMRQCPECLELVRDWGNSRWRHCEDCLLGELDDFLANLLRRANEEN